MIGLQRTAGRRCARASHGGRTRGPIESVGVNEHLQDGAIAWVSSAIAAKWPGAEILSQIPLKGDASSRRFWRIVLTRRKRHTPESVIVIDLGPDDLPRYARALALYPKSMREPPWVNVHRFLKSFDVPVPELYGWSAPQRALLVEDVGSTALVEVARRGEAAHLYRDAVRELIRIHAEGTLKRDPQCVAFQVAYDERLFGWEMEQFIDYGLAEVAPGAAADALRDDVARLARRLGQLPRVFSHRDFHGNNLLVQGDGRIRILDFQDALMAPAAQDLAVLLTTRDTSELITPAIEGRILDFYYAGRVRAGDPALSHEEFLASYRLCVLQHALKVIGRFVYLERSGTSGYARYLPYALGQARRILSAARDEFPRLAEALAP